MLNRPAGPARDERRRGRHGLVLPEVLTVRLLVLAVVLLIAVVLLVPTARAALQQSMELNRLRSDLEQHQAEAARLDRELQRWEDDAFVESQARQKLQFVMPGDRVWRTIGGEELVDDVDPVTGRPVEAGVVGTQGGPGQPWYTTLWESLQVADGPPDEAGHDGAGQGEGAPAGEGSGEPPAGDAPADGEPAVTPGG
ncbi:septum formation initiator family protein [Xylanimonas oleitrophica]|uniref:Septum formation initiator family protein n=1 Tax=Xylanimonas oleitrophica TaxID=2607479 RepID=A0A2W5X0P0_9MICO|nr:septum formation initiator family protein [Xylanimonas oleitrophica]PZR54266.1 septum formation initiator family protein [Xylanimonas oleitrophica]